MHVGDYATRGQLNSPVSFPCRHGSRRHPSALRRLVLALEFIAHLFKSDPFHTLVLVDIFNDSRSDQQGTPHETVRTRESPNLPLMHKKNMRTTRHIRMNSHGEDKFIVLAIEVVKMILPEHQLHQKAPSSNELNPLGQKRSKLTFQSSSTSLGFTQP